MLQVLQEKSVQFLETIVHTLDSYEEIQKRQRVFASGLEVEKAPVKRRAGEFD